ncbi:MAG: hypothetical protein H7263_14135, partial [Candidatus Sericytochromatia bacterium]|nr:hypothetical protein [Candidatus Sericytochromatia bacterium]
MKKLKVYLILFFLFTIPVVAKSINVTKSETNKVYIEAENQFRKHNYQEAFDLYKKITKSKVSDDLKKKSGLKVLETLFILKKWDNLISDLDNYIKVNHNNIWQARAYTLSGKIYQSMPSEGYKRNGKIYRDTTIRDGEYISTYDQDRKLALKSFQKSKEIYYLLQKPSQDVNQYTPTQEIYQEVIDLNFEFANFLTSKSYYYISDYESLSNSTKIKVISNQYNPKSDVKVQIIFLYDEIFSLNRIAKNPHNEAMSLFKKASYYMNNNGIGAIYKKINYKTKNNLDLTNDLPLSEDPIPLLLKIVTNYSNDELAPESLLGLGNIYSSKQDFIKALNTYESLIKKYPSSIKVSDAKAEMQNIKRTSLSVGSLGVQPSDTKPKLSITTKNISNLTVKVYKTDLVKVLKNKLNDQNTNFNNFNHNFGEKINDAKRYFKEKVLSIDVNMGDREDYKAVSKEITLSALKTGSYLVLTEDNKNNSSLTLLIISDIVIIKNIDKSKVYLNVLNRETGKPIPNVNVIIKEHYYTSNSYQSRYKQVFTDSNGSVIYNKKNDTTYSSYIEALAWQGNQLTFSDAQYYYNYYNQTKEYKSYLFTDRPVYRPEQTVYFKDIIRFHDGNYKNVPNEKINVKISDPKGTSIYEKVLTTNKLGSINDSFKLPKKADLGIYNIYTSFVDPNHTREALSQSSGQNFRVEEYKKPEYIVNVKSDNPQIKPGDKAKVKINVNYYFGSPVVAAKVHYKVMRSPFYYYYYKGSQYDWLYGSNSGYEKMYNPSLAQSESTGTVYKEGDLITDSAGNAYVDFETEKSLTDYKYDILANVVDSSRREIKGAGTVKVTQTYFYAFIDFDQGFYEPYENATVEVNLRSPDDQPVKATGDLKIYKVNYTGKNNEKENINLASSQSFTSDDEGRIFYRWKTPSEGYYKFVFETKDKDEKVVKGERYVWINGKNFQGKSYKFQNIEILTDKRTYQEGDTARIMISTDFAKSYILLSTET